MAAIAYTGEARFSTCGTYRYRLTRDIHRGELVPSPRGIYVFAMLNPSTADAEVNDPTVRRCLGYAATWGASRLIVVNLFAYRSTDPRELPQDRDAAVGPDNDAAITEAVREMLAAPWGAIVCAWGNHGGLHRRAAEVRQLIRDAGADPMYLRLTKAKQPEHPLYLPKTLLPQRWVGDA